MRLDAQASARLKIGLPVLAAGITSIAVAAVNISILAPNGKTPPCFPQTCPDLGYYAIPGLAGFFVVRWGGRETIFAALNRGMPPGRPWTDPASSYRFSRLNRHQY